LTKFETKKEAIACWDTHDIIYVPIASSDLSKLLNYLYSGEDGLLTRELMMTIRRYIREKVRR
jgi:hypothetical protein